MLGLAALRAAGSGLESGYSRGRACAISGSDTLSRKNSVSELSLVYPRINSAGNYEGSIFDPDGNLIEITE